MLRRSSTGASISVGGLGAGGFFFSKGGPKERPLVSFFFGIKSAEGVVSISVFILTFVSMYFFKARLVRLICLHSGKLDLLGRASKEYLRMTF